MGLCANDAEDSDELKVFRLQYELNFPVYRDRGGTIAKRFDAQITPEAFLLDEKGVLRYRGGFQPDEAAQDLDATIEHFLAGRPLPRDTFSAIGTAIGEAGVKGSTDDPVEPIVFSSELIFEKAPFPIDHHCSTIAEAPNGDLLTVWFGGVYECADDQTLFIARRNKGDRSWSTPEVLTRGEFLHPPGNAVVFRVNPTRMMVLFDRMDESRPVRCGRWGRGQLMYCHSNDNGYTWSDAAELHAEAGGIRNAPLTLQSGELIVPISNPTPCFLLTRDGGTTWERSGFMERGGQPTFIQRGDGSLLCYMRNRPFILRSESRDLGKTWTPPQPTSLRCPRRVCGLAAAAKRSRGVGLER